MEVSGSLSSSLKLSYCISCIYVQRKDSGLCDSWKTFRRNIQESPEHYKICPLTAMAFKHSSYRKIPNANLKQLSKANTLFPSLTALLINESELLSAHLVK